MFPVVYIVIAATAIKNDFAAPIAIISILFYALLAVLFVWLGIGSIMARRWARALVLVSSWFWLVGASPE